MLASRWREPMIFTLAFGFVSLGWLPAVAHEPLEEQIALLTVQIQQDPQNAALHLRRGELHRHHGDEAAALADYDRAAALDSGLAAVDLARGKMFFEMRRFSEAKIALDRFLSTEPDHAEALVTRARVLVQSDQLRGAVEDYTEAIALQAQLGASIPEHYLERARAQAAQGTENLFEALQGLDEGIARLGPLASLELYAIELELNLERYDRALARLQSLAQKSSRQESWLARRGEILEQAGREEEARLAYGKALKAIETLSPRHRKTRATVKLEAQVRAALARLERILKQEVHP